MVAIPTPREAGGAGVPGHEVWFVEHGDFTRGQCRCGWTGNGRLSRRLAREEADQHLADAGAPATYARPRVARVARGARGARGRATATAGAAADGDPSP